MKPMGRIATFGLTLLLTAGLLAPTTAVATSEPADLTILFTHDLHDRFLPTSDGAGGEQGGFARLMTRLEEVRHATDNPVITVDAGDFSMGSLFQTIYATQAPALRAMGAMGYDVTTLGNHEFDFRQSGLTDMLQAAVASGETLPRLVTSNYKPPTDATETWQAWEAYGITEYTLIERDGVRVAVFGLMGQSAHDYSPMGGMEFEPMAQAAQRMVETIENQENPDYIICLSHAGMDDITSGEDYDLAKGVDGIDVIVSGHTHLTFDAPVQVNDTLIVSCGEYGQNLGVLTINQAGLVDYQLLPVDETVAEDTAIAAMTQKFKQAAETDYLEDYGLGFDQVLAVNTYDFTQTNLQGSANWVDPLGDLIADSYIYAVEQAEGEDYIPVDFAVIAAGVIRDTLPLGEVTTSDVFNVLSLGIGGDGTPGYPLVSAYLTGRELKDLFELDATVTTIMPVAQLWGSGMTWSYNTNRMFFNRVTDCAQVLPDGTQLPLVDDQMYRVVTGLYAVQMLGTVGEQSFGILDITPKDVQGNPIADYEAHIIHDAQGAEVKEWYALASYLDEVGEVDQQIGTAPSSKVITSSWNPIALLRSPNLFTLLALLVVAILVAIIGLIYHCICKKNHRKSFRRYGKRPK